MQYMPFLFSNTGGDRVTSCTAALLPELKPAPCFLYAIIGQT